MIRRCGRRRGSGCRSRRSSQERQRRGRVDGQGQPGRRPGPWRDLADRDGPLAAEEEDGRGCCLISMKGRLFSPSGGRSGFEAIGSRLFQANWRFVTRCCPRKPSKAQGFPRAFPVPRVNAPFPTSGQPRTNAKTNHRPCARARGFNAASSADAFHHNRMTPGSGKAGFCSSAIWHLLL